jgi:hypothetical protein
MQRDCAVFCGLIAALLSALVNSLEVTLALEVEGQAGCGADHLLERQPRVSVQTAYFVNCLHGKPPRRKAPVRREKTA